MNVVPHKRFWQVQNNGYTIAQFDTKEQADSFKEMAGDSPSLFLFGYGNVYRKKVYRETRINIYP